MRSRDESVAIKALIVAVETLSGRVNDLSARMDSGFEMVETKLDAVMGALTDHVTTMHGEDER